MEIIVWVVVVVGSTMSHLIHLSIVDLTLFTLKNPCTGHAISSYFHMVNIFRHTKLIWAPVSTIPT